MIVVTVFAFACAASGWYYLLHAGKAERLSGLERPADNRLRIRLRRWNGAMLVVIGVAFYVGFKIAENGGSLAWTAVCLCGVLLLTPVVLLLVYIDLRLTRKMRQANRRKPQ